METSTTSTTRLFENALHSLYSVSVRLKHIDSYKLLAAHAVGVSFGSLWMDKLASSGRTAARYS